MRYDEGDYHPVEDLHSPSYTYFVTPAADEKSNVFLLCTSADYFSLRYPPQALMTDLFDTLAVPEQALFGGLDGWALQRFDGSQLREGPS